MRKLPVLALIGGLAAGAVGCDDAFLTTEPQDVISNAVFWKTEQDFVAAVNAAYRNMLDTDLLYMECATDFAYSQKDWTPCHAYAQGYQDALTGGWSNGIWGRLYQGISRANEVLTQLENPEARLSEESREQIEAQARFLRGYFYHNLLWLYGGVPIYTKVPTVREAREARRASREEVFDFAMADLTAAAEGLPTSWPSAQYGRATRGAALAYKARAALYEASYQKYHANNIARANELFRVAAEAARAVMDLGVYQLYPDFRGLFTYAGEGSAEVIFDYQHVKGQNGWNAWVWLAPFSMGSDIEMTPTRALVDMFRMKNGLPIDDPASGYDPTPPVIDADGKVVSLGMYANRDPRLYATVLFPGAEFNGEVYNSFPNSPTADAINTSQMSNTHTGFVALKYVDPADQTDRFNSGINIIKMRYADVLLMYAEAKIELGEIDATVADALNQVRRRAGMPDVTLGSQAEMIELVRNERAVELAFEGLRLADIRRWKIAEQVMQGTVAGIDVRQPDGKIVTLGGLWQRKFTAPRDYLWPIPATERDLNPYLEQNPGY